MLSHIPIMVMCVQLLHAHARALAQRSLAMEAGDVGVAGPSRLGYY